MQSEQPDNWQSIETIARRLAARLIERRWEEVAAARGKATADGPAIVCGAPDLGEGLGVVTSAREALSCPADVQT